MLPSPLLGSPESLKKVSPLISNDEPLFRAFVSSFRGPDNLRFEDSWAYIVQATRVCPLKYFSDDVLVLLTLKQDHSALVIPNYFVRDLNVLCEVVDFLSVWVHLPIILKNVGLEDAPRLLDIGFENYSAAERWDSESKYDDQTFPQSVFEIEPTMSMRGRRFADLRRDAKRFVSINSRSYERQIDFNAVEKILRDKCTLLGSNFYAADSCFLKMDPNIDIHSCVYLFEGRIIGFSLTDRISCSCFALNAVIRDYGLPVLFTTITLEAAKDARSQGARYLNLQGAETEGLHLWAKKFCPSTFIHKTHLIKR